jgi:hypothetical protein
MSRPFLPDYSVATSVKRAPKVCDVSRRALTAAIQAGDLVPRAVGLQSVLIRSDLEAWLRSRPVTRQPAPNLQRWERRHDN